MLSEWQCCWFYSCLLLTLSMLNRFSGVVWEPDVLTVWTQHQVALTVLHRSTRLVLRAVSIWQAYTLGHYDTALVVCSVMTQSLGQLVVVLVFARWRHLTFSGWAVIGALATHQQCHNIDNIQCKIRFKPRCALSMHIHSVYIPINSLYEL